MIRFEQLTEDEGRRLRSIRLRALQDAPDAFGTTFEEASANTEETWKNQLAALAPFVAVDETGDVAMVRCGRDHASPDSACLLSMWVAPGVRRSGVGGALVDLVIAWARSNGFSRIVLDVADQNAPAIALI